MSPGPSQMCRSSRHRSIKAQPVGENHVTRLADRRQSKCSPNVRWAHYLKGLRLPPSIPATARRVALFG